MKPLYFFFILIFFSKDLCSQGAIEKVINEKEDLRFSHLMPKANLENDKPGFTAEIKFSANECYHIYSFATRLEVRKVLSSDAKLPGPVTSKFEIEADDFKIADIIKLGEKIVVILECKLLQKFSMIAYEIDRNTCRLKPQQFLLFEVIDDISVGFTHGLVKPDFSNGFADRIVIQTIKTIRGQGFEVYLRVFDNNIKEVFNKKIKFPKVTDNIILQDLCFYNENSFIYSAVTFPDINRKTNPNPKLKYTQHLYFFSDMANKIDDIVVELNGLSITNFKAMLEKDKILVSGFYSLETDNKPRGCFYQIINIKDLSISEEVLNEINADILTSLKSNRKQRALALDTKEDLDVETPEFNLRWLSRNSDGSIYLVAEDIYRTEARISPASMDGSFVIPITLFRIHRDHFDDMLVLKISKNENEKWASKIDRKNTTNGNDYNYALFVNSKEELNVIFNASLKKMDVKNTDKSNTVPVIVKHQTDGKQLIELLRKPEDRKPVVFFPESFQILNNSEVVFKLWDSSKTGYYKFDL